MLRVACWASKMLETLICEGVEVPIITLFPLLFPSTTTRTTMRRAGVITRNLKRTVDKILGCVASIVLRLLKQSSWFRVAPSSWCCLFKPFSPSPTLIPASWAPLASHLSQHLHQPHPQPRASTP
ncbi:hypothetical protein K435DRAFT_865533 [Dendrothele bispora CBS 962.96]|uniref:Uncharacterized protein n=1 Tax=Dendrothele bispora (strain CBS 962.96) TaxID=1314807 RepID=A0A4V4HE07_DENBC|nr:hypothetical protein K435DRAFT_865533 [Dendrothele bispora CBS 962.96]